jgi:hypothetical protein
MTMRKPTFPDPVADLENLTAAVAAYAGDLPYAPAQLAMLHDQLRRLKTLKGRHRSLLADYHQMSRDLELTLAAACDGAVSSSWLTPGDLVTKDARRIPFGMRLRYRRRTKRRCRRAAAIKKTKALFAKGAGGGR